MSPTEAIHDLSRMIITVRETDVILDEDLALLFGVPTRFLRQMVKRNPERFPKLFVFQLERWELTTLKPQLVTSNARGGRRYLPYVFTEYGTLVAAHLLGSTQAIKMCVGLTEAFVRLRQELIFAPDKYWGASRELREAMRRFDEGSEAARASAFPSTTWERGNLAPPEAMELRRQGRSQMEFGSEGTIQGQAGG